MADYAAAASAQIVATYKKANSLQAGVAAVLREAATVYTPDPAISVGCLLVGTALPATVNDPEARRIYAGFITALEQDLTAATLERFAADAVDMGKSPGQVALLDQQPDFLARCSGKGGSIPGGAASNREEPGGAGALNQGEHRLAARPG